MREQTGFKWFAAALIAAAAIITATVPASAATRRRATLTISAGQTYHVLNKSIGTNKITAYTVYVTPANTKTRYDAVIASYPSGKSSQPTEYMVRSTNKGVYVNNAAGTFIKQSAGSNSGMLSCIRVNRGSVTIRVDYTTQSGKAGISFVKQSASHRPLKLVKAAKGRSVNFTMTGSNLTGAPVIMSAKRGAVARRTLGSNNSFEQYTFENSAVAYRVYYKGKLMSSYSRNKAYTNTYSSLRYLLMNAPKRTTNWIQSVNTAITFFYPSDYVGMKVQVR